MNKINILIAVLILGGGLLFVLKPNDHRGATYYYKEKTSTIKKVSGQAKDLPNQLLIEPGQYQVFGLTYNLQQEGLYQFSSEGRTENRIVYKKDPWAIISGVAWLDNPSAKSKRKAKSNEIKQQAMEGYIDLSCGNLSSFTDVLLGEVGIESRSVTGINIDALSGQSDTGHTVLEVKSDNRWHIVDVDNNVVPQKDGKSMTFWEFIQTVSNPQSYDLVKIATDKNDKDEKAIKDYYARLIKVGLINDKRFYYFIDDANYTEKVRNYAKIYMPLVRKDWFEKFYPGYGYE